MAAAFRRERSRVPAANFSGRNPGTVVISTPSRKAATFRRGQASEFPEPAGSGKNAACISREDPFRLTAGGIQQNPGDWARAFPFAAPSPKGMAGVCGLSPTGVPALRFPFTLPTEPRRRHVKPATDPILKPLGPTVFIVDDDASIRQALSSLVRSIGLGVETFSSAREFLEHKRSEAPACLVLDVRMPGLSGMEVQRQLAGSDNQIPIIFVTGHGDIPMSVRAMKDGAVEFLTKPFRDQDLLDAIQQAIERDAGALKQRARTAELRARYEILTRSSGNGR